MAIVLSFVAVPSISQESDPGARLLEETRRQREMEALAQNAANQEIKTPKPKGPVAETPCFPIDEIRISGASIFGDHDFAPILADFSAQCLGQVSIGNLLARVSGLYADAGYITTRAYVPAQDISGRELTIAILEGRIEAYVYQQQDSDGSARPGPSRKIGFALPQKPGDVFQLRDLEHGLEQMNRLRSSSVNANLTAGEAPGTSRVVITEKKKDPIRGSIGMNFRKHDGRTSAQVSLAVEADDLLNLNDQWTLSYSGGQDSNALALGVSIPYRKWLFSLNGSYSEELSVVTATSDLFSQTGNMSLMAERLLARNARSKYFAYGTISSYWNDRYINITALTPQHRSALQFGLRQEHRLEKSVVSADISLTFGTGLFGSDKDSSTLPPGSPRTKFAKLKSRLTYIRPLPKERQLSVSVVGQLANKPLYGNEQISIGGWETVRGYAGQSVAGDNGMYVRSEISFPTKPLDLRDWGRSLGKTRMNPFRNASGGHRQFLFLDAGHVYARADGRSAAMFSAGFGISAKVGNTSVNGTIAFPISNAGGRKKGQAQVYLGITAKTF